MNENKFSVKIPQNVLVLYCKQKKILSVTGPLKKKSLKLKLKIAVSQKNQQITVSSRPFFQASNPEKKKIRILQNSTVAKIKHLIIESSITIHQKLKIVGVGYRLDYLDTLNKKLLTLKLGYSHAMYVKVSKSLNIKCLTKTNFYILGDSYEKITAFSARIRAKKTPDPYKGKGVLYFGELPVLKEGKKV